MAAKRTEKTDMPILFEEPYPRNLLLAVKGRTDLTLPEIFTKDIADGIQYALSTLEEEERELLLLRYREGAPQETAGDILGLDREQVRKLESKALKKLRLPSRWNYLQYGIAGCLKKKGNDEYRRGFVLGYRAGYEIGAEDARNGTAGSGAADEILDLPIEDMQLSAHPYNCLYRMGYRRIRDVVGLRKENIYVIRSLGEKSAREIAQAIQRYGIFYTAWSEYL